ncbi:MAG: triose-phosphate isomerase [Enterobacterales bacterium]
MRYPLIIGNWKLHGSFNMIKKWFIIFNKENLNIYNCNVAIAAPTIYLNIIKSYIKNTKIDICAQNVDFNISGAFTGEVSSYMLKDIGVKYVIIGHSERRKFHQENNKIIIKKFKSIKKAGLIPVLCIGENIFDYKNNNSNTVCINQVKAILDVLGINAFKNTVIAYEPIWTIGTGITANPIKIHSIIQNIRSYLSKYDHIISNNIIIQYGGSIDNINCQNFLNYKNIDGFILGSSSLCANKFCKIIKSTIKNFNNF